MRWVHDGRTIRWATSPEQFMPFIDWKDGFGWQVECGPGCDDFLNIRSTEVRNQVSDDRGLLKWRCRCPVVDNRVVHPIVLLKAIDKNAEVGVLHKIRVISSGQKRTRVQKADAGKLAFKSEKWKPVIPTQPTWRRTTLLDVWSARSLTRISVASTIWHP